MMDISHETERTTFREFMTTSMKNVFLHCHWRGPLEESPGKELFALLNQDPQIFIEA